MITNNESTNLFIFIRSKSTQKALGNKREDVKYYDAIVKEGSTKVEFSNANSGEIS